MKNRAIQIIFTVNGKSISFGYMDWIVDSKFIFWPNTWDRTVSDEKELVIDCNDGIEQINGY